VHANERVLTVTDVAVDDSNVLVGIDVVLVADDPPRAKVGRQTGFGDAVDEALVLQPVRDELRHGDEGEPMLLRECLELRTLRGAAVIVEDLADDTGGIHASKPREVDGGLRVADAL